MKDAMRILKSQGKHSQAMRLIRVTNVGEISALENTIKAYNQEAITIEKSGMKIDFKEKRELIFPEELLARFALDAKLKKAFAALTPGRQRAYNLHFSAAKQSATRDSRIATCVDRILAGKGIME